MCTFHARRFPKAAEATALDDSRSRSPDVRWSDSRGLQHRLLMMIEFLEDRWKRGLYIGKVHDPTGAFAEFTGEADFDAERVTVQSRVLVSPGTLGSRCAASIVKILKMSI